MYLASSSHFSITEWCQSHVGRFLHFVLVLPRRKGTRKARKTRKKRRSQNPRAISQKTKRMVLGFCCGGFGILGHEFWQRLKRVSSRCEQICSGSFGTEFGFRWCSQYLCWVKSLREGKHLVLKGSFM